MTHWSNPKHFAYNFITLYTDMRILNIEVVKKVVKDYSDRWHINGLGRS